MITLSTLDPAYLSFCKKQEEVPENGPPMDIDLIEWFLKAPPTGIGPEWMKGGLDPYSGRH